MRNVQCNAKRTGKCEVSSPNIIGSRNLRNINRICMGKGCWMARQGFVLIFMVFLAYEIVYLSSVCVESE